MATQQSPLGHEHGGGGLQGSRFCLTGITIDRTSADDGDSSEDTAGLAALYVFGEESIKEGGRTFALSKVSPNQWVMEGSIELRAGVEAIDCVVRSEAGEDVGSVRLDGLQQALNPLPGSERSNKLIEGFDAERPTRISWDVVEMPLQRATHEGNNEHIEKLFRNAVSIYNRFEATRSVADISETIEIQRTVVRLTLEEDTNMAKRLTNLGGFLECRFECTGNLQDVDEAITILTKAACLIPEGEANLSSCLNNLAISYLGRFQHMGDQRDLTEAIAKQKHAVSLTPEGNTDLPSQLSNLGNSLMCRFQCTGDLADIAEAIASQKRAVRLTPEGHPDLPLYLNNLGNSFLNQFKRTGDLADVTAAIACQTYAVGITPEGNGGLPSCLNNLGSAFQARFEHTGDLDDIAEAIAKHTHAVGITPETHASLPIYLNNLGNSFQARFEKTGDLEDATEAIERQAHAVRITPEGHSGLPARLNNLGNSFQVRFERTGNLEDATEAIETHTRAVMLTPEGHAGLPPLLHNLGHSFMRRFERTGDLADVANAIAYQTQAVSTTPEGHADLPSQLNNLGNSFQVRFERTGDLDDITEAIERHKHAVSLTPEANANLPKRLSNLGGSFIRRFELTGDLEDLTESVDILTRAVSLTPEGHVDLPMRLSNLGGSLVRRFEQTDNLDDITQAIARHTRAVSLTPEAYASLPSYLNNLGGSLLLRFERAGNLEDLTESIARLTYAVSLIPEGHAELPTHFNNLGNSFLAWFQSSTLPNHLDQSVFYYRLAANCASGDSNARITAALKWATLLDRHRPDSQEVLTAFDTSIRLLALTAGLEETVQRRHSIIQKYAELPLRAAATAFRVERPGKALEWLEHGRCLVWGQQDHLRTPLDELRARDPALADRVKAVAAQLENAGSSSRKRNTSMHNSEKVILENEARTHLQLVREWEDLLAAVRATPGFESFIQPALFSTLVEYLPASGPVVIINVHNRRCDAIALLSGRDDPLHIPLPHFSLEKATEYRKALGTHLEKENLRQRGDHGNGDGEEADGVSVRKIGQFGPPRARAKAEIQKVLKGLWEEVVNPIFSALGISRADPESSALLPRVWWCPTGPLSFLPLHAAGIYGGPETTSAMDYVASSYTPTVTALSQRVKDGCQLDESVSGLLLTCQPNAIRTSPIKGTTKEVASIHEQAMAQGVRSMKREGDEVTPEEYLELMDKFSSVHLACHAVQKAREPLQSRFLFHKGSLNLGKIMQRDLKNADLAFLSACETSTGVEALSDEAVHLAAGMLAAGYRRVVATMWRIGDTHAPKVANDFYRYLWDHQEKGGEARFNGAMSAYALHHATQNLRKSFKHGDIDSALLAWIPFVHFGY